MEEKEKRNTGDITEEKEEGQGIARQEEHKKKKKKDDATEELKRVLAEKEEVIKSLQEKMLYLQAEFENYKKLKIKERQDTLKFGNEVLIKELLPVLDNLEMALDHTAKTEDYKGIYEGVRITFNEFLKVLEKAGVTRIEAAGKKFDPNLHEAFYQEEKEDVEPDTVLSEFQKGYLLNNRLVRPARVVVSKKPEIQ
ncbi:MAG TPA: nucleotide exchange factor GrpE [Syntrophorhabdaceae bacterium]|nr:nucleotide exchange factor GrpE [Syntrophorhabdaceae bacterium]HQM81995.1 nucleotide exchange factor GrpE [Syntrophorhabdaceae bacterium]